MHTREANLNHVIRPKIIYQGITIKVVQVSFCTLMIHSTWSIIDKSITGERTQKKGARGAVAKVGSLTFLLSGSQEPEFEGATLEHGRLPCI